MKDSVETVLSTDYTKHAKNTIRRRVGMPFWSGVKFDEEVPKPNYRLCLRDIPEKCPECGSTEFFLCYEGFAVEENVKRKAE